MSDQKKYEFVEGDFWRLVDKTPDCWLWTGALSNGYGNFKRHLAAHRIAYVLSTGESEAA